MPKSLVMTFISGKAATRKQPLAPTLAWGRSASKPRLGSADLLRSNSISNAEVTGVLPFSQIQRRKTQGKNWYIAPVLPCGIGCGEPKGEVKGSPMIPPPHIVRC